jgi:adenylate kinase family enzyme
MSFFAQNVVPAINYYKSKKRLLKVDGNQSVEKVRIEIDQALKKYLKKNWPL